MAPSRSGVAAGVVAAVVVYSCGMMWRRRAAATARGAWEADAAAAASWEIDAVRTTPQTPAEAAHTDSQLMELLADAVARRDYGRALRAQTLLTLRRRLPAASQPSVRPVETAVLRTDRARRRRRQTMTAAGSGIVVQYPEASAAVRIRPPTSTFEALMDSVRNHRRTQGRKVTQVWFERAGRRVELTETSFGSLKLAEVVLRVTLELPCRIQPHLELGGSVVKWGATNLVDSAEECCSQCKTAQAADGRKCNVWVWCGEKDTCTERGQYRQCWLKHQHDPSVMESMSSGDATPWTSGALYEHVPTIPGPCDGGIDVTISSAPRRECGSPAEGAYSRVDNACLRNSETMRSTAKDRAEREQLQCHVERHASYDGVAVRWGVGHKKDSAEACAEACRQHRPAVVGGPGGHLPCNLWVWCPVDQDECFEPDAHRHRGGDCWLKFTEVPEAPEVNQRGDMGDAYRGRHRRAPRVTQWISGVLLNPGARFSNGTWGPRAQW
eukprot:TRINITY_DN26400_c0_g1_i1.p1 TRINITY_DN26400_c0_g1~~TRINITY_DN26400_c0_g1_i1.p1  ORF type:complete len:497 (+),score=126.50 TRINITY_DN26400_c0_g1_i1:53-1543(+)